MAIPPVQPFSQQPGGGLVTAMRGANALTADNLNNVIKQAEAQYSPWTQYANALSKIAYSQFVGPQSLAAMLSSPATRGLFNQSQIDQLTNAFSNQMQGQNSALSNIPAPNQMGGMGQGLLGRLFHMLSGGQQPQGTNAMMQPPQPGFNMSQASPSQSQDFGIQNYATPDQVQQIIDRNRNIEPPAPTSSPLSGTSPTYSRLQGNLPAGAVGAVSPTSIIQSGEQALKAGGEQEAKNIASQWKDRQDEINTQVGGAQEMERQLDRMVEARSRLGSLEKGAFLGKLPAITDAAQSMDQDASNLIAARLRAWQSARITNKDLDFGQMLKPGRWMNDQSFNDEVNYEKGLAERLQEYPAFANQAQKAGLTPSQADAIWARYANERPFFDTPTKKILDENLGAWEPYLTKNSIAETFSPSSRKKMDQYKKNMVGGNNEFDKKLNTSLNKYQNEPSPGAKILAKKLELPPFKNAQEFNAWLKKQPKIVKDAVRIKLGEK